MADVAAELIPTSPFATQAKLASNGVRVSCPLFSAPVLDRELPRWGVGHKLGGFTQDSVNI